jgi:hypothetical protein
MFSNTDKNKYKKSLNKQLFVFNRQIKQYRNYFYLSFIAVSLFSIGIAIGTYYSFKIGETYFIIGLFFLSLLSMFFGFSKVPSLLNKYYDLENRKMLYITKQFLNKFFKNVKLFEGGKSKEYLYKSFSGAFKKYENIKSGVQFEIVYKKTHFNFFTVISDSENLNNCNYISYFEFEKDHGINAEFTILKIGDEGEFWEKYKIVGADKDQLTTVLDERKKRLIERIYNFSKSISKDKIKVFGKFESDFLLNISDKKLSIAMPSSYPAFFPEKTISSIVDEYLEKVKFSKQMVKVLNDI